MQIKTILLLLIFTIIANACCKKPGLVDIEKYNITIPADSAVILESKTIVTKQSNAEADFAYYNLTISAPFKSFVNENAISVNGLLITNEMFEAISNKNEMYKLINEKISEGDGTTLGLNENLSPYALKYKYIHIKTKQNKDCIIRIDNYKAGEQQNLTATIIMEIKKV
jgi:hypothetical protein